MILGFLLTALYWPGIAGAATTPRWGLLAVALPIVLLFGSAKPWLWPLSLAINEPLGAVKPQTSLNKLRWGAGNPSLGASKSFTLIHLFGALYLTWSAISLSWTPNGLDGFGELAKLAILAQSFLLGTRLASLSCILKSMALGIGVSSIVLLVQLYSPDIVLHTTTHSGLFINSGSLAEIAALVLIGLVYDALGSHADSHARHSSKSSRGLVRLLDVALILALLPCIIFPQSRGAWLALVTAFTIWLWFKSKLSALGLMGLTAILITYSLHLGFHVTSVTQRLGMWGDALRGLSLLGHGIGSFWTDYAPLSNTLDIFVERPEHLHNDWLEIVFEGGLTGFGLLLCLGWQAGLRAVHAGGGAAAIILCGFTAESTVGFTLHNPCTAFLAAVCLGHLARNGHSLRYHLHARRIQLRAWLERQRLTKHGTASSRECEVVSIGSQV